MAASFSYKETPELVNQDECALYDLILLDVNHHMRNAELSNQANASVLMHLANELASKSRRLQGQVKEEGVKSYY